MEILQTRSDYMTMREAQALAVKLNDSGLSAWAVEGFRVNLIVDGVLFEINKSKNQPNERS